MTYSWLLAVALLKVVAAFLVIFVYLPTRIFPQRAHSTRVGGFFENLVLMAFFSFVVAHGLALLRIYSLPSLLMCYGLLYLGSRWYREREALLPSLRRSSFSFNVFVLRTLEGLEDVWGIAKGRLAELVAGLRRAVTGGPGSLHTVLFLAILGVAAWLRTADVVRNAPLSFSDSYYHLEALKRFEAGEPYWEDLYPRGFQAFMSVIHLTTWVDPALVLKLIGPLLGVLIVLSVYYATLKVTENRNAALVAMLIAGIVDAHSSALFDWIGSDRWLPFFGDATAGPFMQNFRQTAGLPQEFALVFLLPTLLLAHEYWTEQRTRRAQILLFMSTTVVFMSHWIIGLVLAAGLVLLTGLALLQPGLAATTVAYGFGAYVLAGLVGNFQFAGLLGETGLAHANSGRAGYAQALPGGIAAWLDMWGEAIPISPGLYVAAGVAIFVTVYGLIAIRGMRRKILWGFLGMFTLALLFEVRSINFGIRYVIPPDRTGEFLGIVLPVALGAVWTVVTRSGVVSVDHWRLTSPTWLSRGITILTLLAVLVVALPAGFASAPRYEYRSLAELYYQISRHYQPLQWTIVSNVEDYSKVLTKGWHVNGKEFLARYNPHERVIGIPTPYVFIFVEKVPLQTDRADQGHGVRHDEQRRLREWVFTRTVEFQDLTLYYEDDAVLVYLWQGGTLEARR